MPRTKFSSAIAFTWNARYSRGARVGLAEAGAAAAAAAAAVAAAAAAIDSVWEP